jgi:hypothetical protein
MAFTYKNKKGQDYFLHHTQVTLKGSGKKQNIYYFARKTGKDAIDALPEGYQVMEVEKTGLPVLKKKAS